MRADAQAKRQEIIRAAKELILEEGLDASFRSIAARAGVGVATVHRHFPERIDLLGAVLPGVLEEVRMLFAAHEGEWRSDPEAAWYNTVLEFSGMEAIILREGVFLSIQTEPGADSLREKLMGELRPLLGELLERAAAHGFVAADLDPIRFHLGLAAVSRPLPEIAERLDPGFARWAVENYLAGLRADAPAPPGGAGSGRR